MFKQVALSLVLLATPVYAASITCLGRIEPLDGVRVLAGPSGFNSAGAVISELRVNEGDWVEANQVLAVFDGFKLYQAEVDRQQQLLEESQVALKRLQTLGSSQSISQSSLDEARYRASTQQAELGVAAARLEMTILRAPQRGQILKIYTYPGEKVGPEGVLELGETDKMTVVAEVYETDVHRVAAGQEATITSPALKQPAQGKVTKVGYRVGKMDVLSADPVADTDARVVEATILMNDPAPLARLTNLHVDVEIRP